jgi:hypothetical protein
MSDQEQLSVMSEAAPADDAGFVVDMSRLVRGANAASVPRRHSAGGLATARTAMVE